MPLIPALTIVRAQAEKASNKRLEKNTGEICVFKKITSTVYSLAVVAQLARAPACPAEGLRVRVPSAAQEKSLF